MLNKLRARLRRRRRLVATQKAATRRMRAARAEHRKLSTRLKRVSKRLRSGDDPKQTTEQLRERRERLSGDRDKARHRYLRNLNLRDKTAAQRGRVSRNIVRIRRRIRAARDAARAQSSAWGGSQAVAEQVVVRAAEQFGVWISSRKRAADHYLSRQNPASDHNEAVTNAYAWDLATYNGEPVARWIAGQLGISNWQPGTYTHYFVVRNGVTFRVQILWAVAGHFDHVHVGVRRV